MTWWTDVDLWPAELAVWMYTDCCGADLAEHCQWPCETWLVLGCHRPHEPATVPTGRN